MLRKFFIQPGSVADSQPTVDLVEAYHHRVQCGHITFDKAQLALIEHMQVLMDRLIWHDKHQDGVVFRRLFSASPLETNTHLYVYGGVGLGKSMLMDLFFSLCPIKKKRRVHFHDFMQEVHEFIHRRHSAGHRDDVIRAFAKQIRNQTLLLCFDEFHTMDIADAKIIERLFRTLFEFGLITMITSNRHPKDLYRGGFLEQQFKPFVDLLMQSSNIVELAGSLDYRCDKDPGDEQTCLVSTCQDEVDGFIQANVERYAQASAVDAGVLSVYGRSIQLSGMYKETLVTSFAEMCGRPFAAADYLAVTQRFNVLIMRDIPKLEPADRNEAKRFSVLIDTIYEKKLKFVCTSAVPITEIYTKGKGAYEFKRTISRLIEMQSQDYLSAAAV